MFGNLFEDDGLLPSGPNTSPNRMNNCVPSVPERRGKTKLCGLENLGATCYLNSLIQTLLFTPEFREGLLSLDLEPPESGDNVRIIPLQLQRLFTQLLLLDTSSVSTSQLTESFGWTDHEELYQQQDVQELIRILFFAIQKSLVGTPGHDLISRLYQGSTVSQVECSRCGFVSVRDESYLDLTVAVGQNKTLKSCLFSAYCEPEIMDGSNQYLCPTCKCLTDASKMVKLRHLPPILTLSLLRFLYDPAQQQRFKDKCRVEFPLELDMAPFCEEQQPSEVTVYELLSVIVHQGGAHGGHYHAIIRDVDELGSWDTSSSWYPFSDKDQTLKLPDILITEILQEQQDSTLTLQQLLDQILKRTGHSWSKSYKDSYGPITKFLESKCAQFFVEGKDLEAFVTLISEPNLKNACNGKIATEPIGRQWFDFNDGEVSPVFEQDIEKHFEGEESAYMLVYRRKNLVRPLGAHSNPAFSLPIHLQHWIIGLNAQLNLDRESSHLLWLRILPRSSYNIHQRSLYPMAGRALELELTIDDRESLSTLKCRAKELCEEFGGDKWEDLHSVQQSSSYNLMIQDSIPDSDSVSLEEYKLHNGQALLAWNCDSDMDSNEPIALDVAWEESVVVQPLHTSAAGPEPSGNNFTITMLHTMDGKPKEVTVAPSMTVANLRQTAEWELGVQAHWDTGCLAMRLGEDIHSLEPPLYDHLSLVDACINPGCTVYIDPRPHGPIMPSQVWLSFTVDDPSLNRDSLSVIMESEDTVANLVETMLKVAELDEDETWHVGRVNWSGEVETVLRNPDATLQIEGLLHGTHLVLRRGSALLRGLTRLKILLLDPMQEVTNCPSKPPKLCLLGHVDMNTENSSLVGLKAKIIPLLEERNIKNLQDENLRVRVLIKSLGRPGKVLKDKTQSLKSLNVSKNSTLVVELLQDAEKLFGSQILLQVWRHLPGGYYFQGPRELAWDLASSSLSEAVSHFFEIPQHQLVMAKYQPKSHDWQLIDREDAMRTGILEQGKRKGMHCLLIPPYNLNDGDIIGIKDSSTETEDLEDFMTASDFERWLAMQEEADHLQKNEEAAAIALEWTNQGQHRMPERGIHIHVSDFC